MKRKRARFSDTHYKIASLRQMTFIHTYLQLTKLRVSRTSWPPDVYRPAFAVLGAVRKRNFHLHDMSCGNEEYSISRLSKLLHDIVYQNGLLSCTDLILDNAEWET